LPAIANDGDGCTNRQSVSHSSTDHEQVQTVRIDYNINEKNTTWFRFQTDNGLQAAYTDPINPLFNALSPQPLYSFAFRGTGAYSGPRIFRRPFSRFPSFCKAAVRMRLLPRSVD